MPYIEAASAATQLIHTNSCIWPFSRLTQNSFVSLLIFSCLHSARRYLISPSHTQGTVHIWDYLHASKWADRQSGNVPLIDLLLSSLVSLLTSYTIWTSTTSKSSYASLQTYGMLVSLIPFTTLTHWKCCLSSSTVDPSEIPLMSRVCLDT